MLEFKCLLGTTFKILTTDQSSNNCRVETSCPIREKECEQWEELFYS